MVVFTPFFMLKTFFQNRSLFFVTIASFVLVTLLWGVTALNVPERDQTAILHYSIYLGVDEVGAWYRLFLFPLSGTIILAVNTVMAMRYMETAKLFSLFLIYSSLCLQVLLGIEGSLILLRNM